LLRWLYVLLIFLSPVFLWEISYLFSKLTQISSGIYFYFIAALIAISYGYSQKDLFIHKPSKKTNIIWACLVFYCILLVIVPFLSSYLRPSESNNIPLNMPHWFLAIILIPTVEEYIFRKQLSSYLKKQFSPAWLGSYCSVFIFSFAHTHPLIKDFYSFDLGIALGPLLLGVICEFLTHYSKSILPAIVFHGICNASGFIFGMLDSRWLMWLKDLYSHG